MKLTKRITSLILSLVMLVSLACTGAWTPHVHAEEVTPLDDLQIVHINPLYADSITEDDLVKPDRNTLYADNTDDEYYYDATSAGEMIRDDLVARDTTIVVDAYCEYTSEETINQDWRNLVYDIMAVAMAHTGNPEEGDYLLWQYTGFEADITNAMYQQGYVYGTITYTMTYYTSADQEAKMDSAVNNLLGQLNVSGSSAYGKLKAIYDYITSNVTYDNANANNDSYKLKHTAYAALVNKTAVCQGYALLLYRLALELGVDCRLIAGTGNGENHGWNIAKIDNVYYNLDSTWDAGRTEYKYFLVSPKNFTDHSRWDEYNTAEFHAVYPMAEYNYSINCSHTYSAVVTTKPTCIEKGVNTYTCSKCGDSYTEAIPSTGHNYDKSVATAPTCTDKGYTTHTCSGCGDSYQNTFVDATGHSYDAGVVTKEATCAVVGVKTFTCSVCKDSYTVEIPKLDHIYDKTAVTAPTCTEKGYTTHTCTACGDSYQDTFVDATGHSYDDGVITKEATCTEAGSQVFTCSVCKDSYTKEIPMIDHVYDKTEIIAPTCTEKGYTAHICVCGDSYQDTFVDATGHNYDNGVITTEATCTTDGIKTYTCAECGDTFTEVIAVLGHAYDDGKVITAANCTEYGTLIHTCSRCNSTINAYVDPLGHAYDEGTVTTEPTCTEEGVMTYACIRGCGNTTTGPAPALGHGWDDGIVITEPTCTEEGVKSYTCTRGCGYGGTVAIPANDHNFENGACVACGIKAVAITAEPKTAYAKMGDVAKATVTAEGDELSYQWYIKNAGGKKYSKSSVTGPTYSCKMSEKSKDRRALCIITDKYGNKVQSKTIVIREAVSIVTEPKTAYAKAGDMAKVTMEVSGDDLTYQWYVRNTDETEYTKSSVTSSSYSCRMSDASKDRRVLCIVKDKYGNKVQTKTVMIRMAATITAQPKSVTAKNGTTAKATVEAVGDGLTYQWYIKNAGSEKFVKSSIKDATYTVTMSKKVDGREAYCVITDQYGKTVRSSVITLTMK